MNEQIDLGDLIKRKLKEKERSVAWLARKLSCDRSNLHKILKQYDIPPSKVRKISQILGYDFLKHCSPFSYELESDD